MTDSRVVALIPARGGSKRIRRKNIKPLSGKPLLAWSIDAATNSKKLDDIIVSTDDDEIAELALSLGARVPFKRPKEIATDDATTVDVVVHALDYLENEQSLFETIIVLQPTSPLRSAIDIDNSIDMLKSKDAKAVISVCEVEHSPLWANTLPTNLLMKDFIPQKIVNTRSQDLPTYYRLNGAVYVLKTDVVKKEKTLFPNSDCYAYLMPQERSIDIDTELDFHMANALINYKTNEDNKYYGDN